MKFKQTKMSFKLFFFNLLLILNTMIAYIIGIINFVGGKFCFLQLESCILHPYTKHLHLIFNIN